METVRGILAAHHSGISKPGLLAWARLRIDTTMTDAQLDEELARLGDEVIDVEGFLYLRANVEPGRLRAVPERASGAAGGSQPEGSDWTRTRPESPPSAPSSEPAWPPPAEAREARGGCGGWAAKAVGLAVFLLWAVGFVGGFIETGSEATPEPTEGATEPAGTRVGWTDLAIGDCFTHSEEDGGTIRRLACDQPHGYELFEIASHPGAAFPGESSFVSFSEDVCPRAFAEYTGRSPDEQRELTWLWWSPSAAEWNDGIRSVECMLAPVDGSLTDRSYRSGF